MWHDEAGCLRRWLALAGIAAVFGCASAAVFAERRGDRPRSSVLRLATERGIKDVSTDELRQLEVPIEVRADSMQVVLPGCAVRPFWHQDLDDVDFVLDSIREVPFVTAFAVPSTEELERRRDEPVRRQAFPAATVVVDSGQRRMVTITVVASRSELGENELGVRLDSSPGARFAEAGACPSLIASTDSAYVEHYALPGVFIESGGMAIAASALLLALIVIVTGR